MIYRFIITTLCFFTCHVYADPMSDCLSLMPPIEGTLRNNTIVSVTHDNKTRIYTTKGYFEFRADSIACSLFDSRRTIYDVYADAFKSYLKQSADLAENGSMPNLDSLEKRVAKAKAIQTCKNVDVPQFRKKILDVLETIKPKDMDTIKTRTPSPQPGKHVKESAPTT